MLQQTEPGVLREREIVMDWIDQEAEKRRHGIRTPLLPSQHQAVNDRYPGCTLEYCSVCGKATGRAGKGEDSLFGNDGDGPYCYDCWPYKE